MAGYILRRLVQAVLILIGVSFVAFVLLYVLPADPAQMMVGRTASASGQIEIVRHAARPRPAALRALPQLSLASSRRAISAAPISRRSRSRR